MSNDRSGTGKTLHMLHRIDSGLSRFESALLVLTLVIMIAIAFAQVLLRNFFNSGILWGDTLVRHLVLWVGFLGASLATKENRHINIDALWRVLPEQWQRRTRRLTNLFSACICLLLSRAAYVFVRDELNAGSTLFLNIPAWLFMVIILFGFIVISMRYTLKCIVGSEGA